MKPIIMSTEMVRSILDGRKTMTRRTSGLNEINKNPADWNIFHCVDHGRPPFWRFVGKEKSNDRPIIDIDCPYGQVGSKLWVRETLRHSRIGTPTRYASDDCPVFRDGATPNEWPFRTQVLPSIHMPHWASRITKEIIRLWVERLLDISEADARAEGFNSVEEFLFYWDKLNKKRGYGTNVNPWNWCIEWPSLSG